MNTVVIPLRQSEITQEVTITDNYAMTVGDRTIIANLAASKSLTLPPVREAAGHVFSIFGLAVTGNAVTIGRNSEDTVPINFLIGLARQTSITLDTNGDYAILYSDGFHWHLIAGNIQ